MPYQLKGRNVLVTGGSKGLGAYICRHFASEGCNIAINYAHDGDAAAALSKELTSVSSQESIRVIALQGDCSVAEDNARLVREAHAQLGGLDIVIANAGWTRFAKWDLEDFKPEEWDRCWRANVMAHVQLLQIACPIFNENADGGVFISTSSIAGRSTAGSSIGYAVTKAAGLHLMKCLAASQGPKIRFNAVLPGLLLTEWGLRFGEENIKRLEDRAVLKKSVDLDDCAEMYVSIAKNSSMTGQEIIVDSGLVLGSSR